VERFPFAFDARFRALLRLYGVTEATAEVVVGDGQLRVRFGRWRLETALTNIAGTRATGPYRWFRVIGPHLSLTDRGVSFGTNTRRGLCVLFADPVPGGEPTGWLRHPGMTVTVAEPERLAAALQPS
jgi:hypothetical protein